MNDPEEEYEKFNMLFDSKYKEVFEGLGHPYLFVGVVPTDIGHQCFVAGDLKEATRADILMMRITLATAFDNLIADKATAQATGYKRKGTEDMELSSEDIQANERMIMLTSSIALVYRVLIKIPSAESEDQKRHMLESISEVLTDLENLRNVLELPDVIDMKIGLLVDGMRDFSMEEKYVNGLKVLAKELVDHYMEKSQ